MNYTSADLVSDGLAHGNHDEWKARTGRVGRAIKRYGSCTCISPSAAASSKADLQMNQVAHNMAKNCSDTSLSAPNLMTRLRSRRMGGRRWARAWRWG